MLTINKSINKLPLTSETPLRHLPLDSSSISEVIRIHLLVGYDESCGTSDEDNNEVSIPLCYYFVFFIIHVKESNLDFQSSIIHIDKCHKKRV